MILAPLTMQLPLFNFECDETVIIRTNELSENNLAIMQLIHSNKYRSNIVNTQLASYITPIICSYTDTWQKHGCCKHLSSHQCTVKDQITSFSCMDGHETITIHIIHYTRLTKMCTCWCSNFLSLQLQRNPIKHSNISPPKKYVASYINFI